MPHDDIPTDPPADPPAAATKAGRRRARRPRDGVRRPHSLTVALSTVELAALDTASARAGLSVGAYVASSALARATAPRRPAPLGDELARRLSIAADEATTGWRVLRVATGLLNQVAKTGNSTGTLPPQTREVLARVAHATQGADAAATALHALAGELAARLHPPTRARQEGR